MAIYDNDGSASHAISSIYDNDGSANHLISKIYDNDGSANHLLYPTDLLLIDGASDTGSGITWTLYIRTNPGVAGYETKETQSLTPSNQHSYGAYDNDRNYYAATLRAGLSYSLTKGITTVNGLLWSDQPIDLTPYKRLDIQYHGAWCVCPYGGYAYSLMINPTQLPWGNYNPATSWRFYKARSDCQGFTLERYTEPLQTKTVDISNLTGKMYFGVGLRYENYSNGAGVSVTYMKLS